MLSISWLATICSAVETFLGAAIRFTVCSRLRLAKGGSETQCDGGGIFSKKKYFKLRSTMNRGSNPLDAFTYGQAPQDRRGADTPSVPSSNPAFASSKVLPAPGRLAFPPATVGDDDPFAQAHASANRRLSSVYDDEPPARVAGGSVAGFALPSSIPSPSATKLAGGYFNAGYNVLPQRPASNTVKLTGGVGGGGGPSSAAPLLPIDEDVENDVRSIIDNILQVCRVLGRYLADS
jgi:hypothetical protein